MVAHEYAHAEAAYRRALPDAVHPLRERDNGHVYHLFVVRSPERDALARLTGSALHFRRLTTEGSLAMVKAARRAGLGITVEAAVQHAVLTDAALADYDPMAVFRPPLRPESDRAALVVALAALVAGGAANRPGGNAALCPGNRGRNARFDES